MPKRQQRYRSKRLFGRNNRIFRERGIGNMEGIAHKELGEGYYVHIDAYMKEPDGEERVAYHYDGDKRYTGKLYESKKGRKYFQVDGERLYLDEFKTEV